MMETLFDRLGFTQREREVYLALANSGKASAPTIARRMKIPRSSAFSVLGSLVSHGVVTEEQSGGSTYFILKDPSSLVQMVQARRREQASLFAEQQEAAEILSDLVQAEIKSRDYSVPRLQFWEGPKNVHRMLYDSVKSWQESVAKYDNTWWGYQDHEFVMKYGDWIAHHAKLMKEDERVWLFSNRSEIEEKLEGKIARRQIKRVPEDREFSSTIWVLGDYVVTLMIRQQPHYAFVLHDALFARNQRILFQLMWQTFG